MNFLIQSYFQKFLWGKIGTVRKWSQTVKKFMKLFYLRKSCWINHLSAKFVSTDGFATNFQRCSCLGVWNCQLFSYFLLTVADMLLNFQLKLIIFAKDEFLSHSRYQKKCDEMAMNLQYWNKEWWVQSSFTWQILLILWPLCLPVSILRLTAGFFSFWCTIFGLLSKDSSEISQSMIGFCFGEAFATSSISGNSCRRKPGARGRPNLKFTDFPSRTDAFELKMLLLDLSTSCNWL